MLTQERIDRRSGAGIWDKGQINISRAFEYFDRDMRSASGANTRQGQVAGLGACSINEIGERAIGRCTVDDDDRRRSHQVANRLEARQWIVVHLSEMRIDHKRIPGDQQGVTIRRGARHSFGCDG
jgi:hypothetical protein